MPIFNDQSFNDLLTDDIVSFEHLEPGKMLACFSFKQYNIFFFLGSHGISLIYWICLSAERFLIRT